MSESVIPTSIAELRDAVRAAHAERAPMRIVGQGTWVGAGQPVRASRTLKVSGLTGIVEYVPGDLTLTALAGTPLSEIVEATAAHQQFLPLDPYGQPDGTLGATLATASAGPLAGSIGLPRDVTVGVAFVSGTGELVRGGGKVVKNVAGFDLVRLTIGAWGTLGVIAEATVRLRARPEVEETIAVALPGERDALSTLLANVRTAAVEPMAAELLSRGCAARVGLGDQDVMLVRLAGNAHGVLHQRAVLEKLAACREVDADVWPRLQRSDPSGAAIVRVSRRPSELARLWTTAMNIPDVDATATLPRGVVRIRLTSNGTNPLDAFDAGDRQIFEVLPQWPATGSPSDGHQGAIAQRLRNAFDPGRILNPGILGADES
jgi:glycolate oxidase FAD binding subunit